ncbi:MAG: Rrf2 family transcriptional regulator, partial [Thermoguttaceae bacterium]|nr:Rrf2 family transcriptional regulator [Thermoguttaceae bacterium]
MESKSPFPTWPIDAARPSARAECAALAVFELALERPTGRPTAARKIAEKYGLSERFLTQILQRLRRFGIVETERGSFGGFRLIADPAELTLGFVVAAAESSPLKSEKAEPQERAAENVASTAPAFGKDRAADKRRKPVPATSPNAEADATRALFDRAWRDAETKRQEFLNAILISELLDDARKVAPVDFTI